MSDLRRRLYASWIARLGHSKVSSLAKEVSVDPGSSGETKYEKGIYLVDAYTYPAMDAMITEGFGSHYHQTVYLRRIDSNVGKFSSAKIGTIGGVRVRHVSGSRDEIMMLFPVSLEFLPPSGGTFEKTLHLPVMARVAGGKLRIHVLTFRCTPEYWSWIVESPVRRPLVNIKSDSMCERVLTFLDESFAIGHGSPVNYSAKARKLMQDPETDVYSGTLEARSGGGPVGGSKHYTIGSPGGRQPLREAMPSEFAKILAATRIHQADLQLNQDHRFLKKGTTLVLYPATGKLTCRANLKGGDLHGFIDTLA